MSTLIRASLAAFLGLTVLAGCTSGGGGDDSGDPGTGGAPVQGDGDSLEFRTDCGVVSGGELLNPISSSNGVFAASVTVAGSNLVIIDTGSGPQLVKLHGLAANQGARASAAINRLNALAGSGAYFFKATAECSVVTPGGGVGTSGQLISPSGASYTEELIRAGLAGGIDSSGSCGENLIASCYSALRDQFTPVSAGEIDDFLWKPVAERDGKLVVLVNPCDADVVVNGEHLVDFGPGNGRCTQARSPSKSGCGYGANAKVQVFNSQGVPYLFPDGSDTYTIANGCDRTEFKA